ncbi:MAG: hypothetical protein H0V95_00700 [Actinobacteria bacterium]|nr:hypothetical protein [Actinomycetota bacterium]
MADRTVSLLAGQLDFLFEEQPELRSAPAARLLDRLNREDRLVRARAEEPLENDRWVQRRADELDDRFTARQVEEALELVKKRGPA